MPVMSIIIALVFIVISTLGIIESFAEDNIFSAMASIISLFVLIFLIIALIIPLESNQEIYDAHCLGIGYVEAIEKDQWYCISYGEEPRIILARLTNNE